MGAQRSSLSKLQRDRDKQAKAAVKRERRQNRDAPVGEDGLDTDQDGADAAEEVDSAQILVQVEQLQRDFDAHAIDFESYEKRKSELLGQIKI